MLDEVVEHAARTAEGAGEQGLAATDTREVDDAVVAAVGHDAMGISVAGRPRRARRLRRAAGAAAVEAAARRGAAQPDPGGGAAPRGRRRPHGAARAAGARRARASTTRACSPASGCSRPTTSSTRPSRPPSGSRCASRPPRSPTPRAWTRCGSRPRSCASPRCWPPAGRTTAVAARRALEPLAVDRHRPRTMWMVSLLDAGAHPGPRRHRRGRRRRARRPAPRPGARAARRRRRLRGAPAGAPPARAHPALAPGPARRRGRHVPAASRRGRPPPRWTPRSPSDLDHAASHLADWHRKREGREGRLFDRPGLCLAACAAFALGDVPTAEVVAPRRAPPTPARWWSWASARPPSARSRSTRASPPPCSATGPEARRLLGQAATVADGLGWAPWADAARGFVRYVKPGQGRPAGGPPLPPDARPLGLLPPP